MKLEDAIQHCEEKMIELLEKTKDRNASDPVAIECFECADEHRQLAEWLIELKLYREKGCCAFCEHKSFEESATCFMCPAGISYAKNKIARVVEK